MNRATGDSAGKAPRSLFGTDGIRGVANQEPMTAETVMKVGAAAGSLFVRGDHRHRVVIGKDTRLSGYVFEPALTAGFVSMGMDAILVGPMPTPAVAMLTRALRADLGVMISASHNPYADNGIKLFGPDGYKLSDETEARIEALVDSGVGGLAAPDALGRARRLDDAEGRYIEFVKNSFPRTLNLEDRRIVIDCAHGAAYKVAPTVLWELGADVITIGTEPDGVQHQPGLRLHRHGLARAHSGGTRRGHRHRARWRRRPGRDLRRDRRGHRRRSHHGADRLQLGRCRAAQGRRRGRDGHVQPWP